jgi:outer membrane protein OmpA-like peptidoglycan-associated protein
MGYCMVPDKKEKKEGKLKLCFTFNLLKPLTKLSFKHTMKILTSIILFIQIVVFTAFSQSDFKYTESIKEVQENLLNNDFTESLYILKKLEKDGYSNANMNYLIGVCYLNSLSNKSLSVNYLKKTINFISKDYNPDNAEEKNAPAEALLYLGDANLVNNNIKEAREWYIKYLNVSYIEESKKDIARSRLKNCLFARLQINKPLQIQLKNAGKIINTGIANSNVCISADGKKMVFLKTMKFYDAVYYSVKTDTGWLEPQNITTQIRSDGDFIPTSLSPDGTHLLLKSFADPNGNEIYESVYNGKKWAKVKRLAEPLNSKYHDIDASYGPDGSTIYFSSNRAGGYGGYDIYKAIPDDVNKTYSIENLGNSINTIGDEKSPSIIEDGKVIIFSSDYRNSIGGYDFYYSQLLNDNKWAEPLDIGYPVNTTSDDNDLKFTATSPKTGFLTRFESNGYSDNDIFFFDCPLFSTLKLIPLSGKLKINDSTYSDSKDITLAVVDVAEKDTAFILNPNSDGSYFAELYPGNFNLVVNKNGKKELEQNFTIPSDYNGENFIVESTIEKPLPVTPVKQDTIYIVDILFGFNKYEIESDEIKILSDIITGLKKYTIKNIRLNGYTDALGTEAYNQTLSSLRAQNVKEFMIGQGLTNVEITTEGKGNSLYVAKNTYARGKDNPEGRAYNRRVEILITLESNNVVVFRKNRVPLNLKINGL